MDSLSPVSASSGHPLVIRHAAPEQELEDQSSPHLEERPASSNGALALQLQNRHIVERNAVPEGCLAIDGGRLSGILNTPIEIHLILHGQSVSWPISIAELRQILLCAIKKEGLSDAKIQTVAQGSYLSWLLKGLKYKPKDFDIAIKAPPDTPNQSKIMETVAEAFLTAIRLSFPQFDLMSLKECGVKVQLLPLYPDVSLATFIFATPKGEADVDLSLQFVVDQEVDFSVGSLRAVIDPFFEASPPPSGDRL